MHPIPIHSISFHKSLFWHYSLNPYNYISISFKYILCCNFTFIKYKIIFIFAYSVTSIPHFTLLT